MIRIIILTRPVREDMGGFSIMTDKDSKLIEKAEDVPVAEWPEVLDMAKEADTEEARRRLKQIAMRMMHIEEHSIGNL